MKAVTRFLRKWWWLILLGCAVVFAVAWKILKGGGGDESITDLGITPRKTFVEKARDEVEKVHLEGEIEKAKVRTVASEQLKQIEAIEKKGADKPKEARRELAAFLATNL